MKHSSFDEEEFSPILIAPLVQAPFHCLSWWQRPPRAAFLAYDRCYDRVCARCRARVHDRVHDRVRGRDRDRVLKDDMSASCTAMKMI